MADTVARGLLSGTVLFRIPITIGDDEIVAEETLIVAPVRLSTSCLRFPEEVDRMEAVLSKHVPVNRVAGLQFAVDLGHYLAQRAGLLNVPHGRISTPVTSAFWMMFQRTVQSYPSSEITYENVLSSDWMPPASVQYSIVLLEVPSLQSTSSACGWPAVLSM